jgi:hypothetical protein
MRTGTNAHSRFADYRRVLDALPTVVWLLAAGFAVGVLIALH